MGRRLIRAFKFLAAMICQLAGFNVALYCLDPK